MTLVVSLQVSTGQHWGLGLTLTFNVASQLLICVVVLALYCLHLIFEEGLMRLIVRVLLGPGVWA